MCLGLQVVNTYSSYYKILFHFFSCIDFFRYYCWWQFGCIVGWWAVHHHQSKLPCNLPTTIGRRLKIFLEIKPSIWWQQPSAMASTLPSTILASCMHSTRTSDSKNIMWWLPDRTNFFVKDGVLHRVGRLCGVHFLEIWNAVSVLLTCSDQAVFCKKPIMRTLAKLLWLFLHQLQFILASYSSMHQTVCELQCVFLDLRGFLDFEENYCHETNASKTNCALMGVFTMDLTVAQDLFKAGVPVWLIWPLSKLPSIHVWKLVPLTRPEDMSIPLDASVYPSYSTIFHGCGDCQEKHTAISNDATSCLRYPNPFGTTHPLPIVNAPPVVPSTKWEAQSKKYSPCEYQLNKKNWIGISYCFR